MLEAKLKELYISLKQAKKLFSKYPTEKNARKVDEINEKIKKTREELAATRKAEKAETDRQATFARAAKPFLDAQKLVNQKANYSHFEEIDKQYEISKANHERAVAKAEAEALRKRQQEDAENERIKKERAEKKAAKKAAKEAKKAAKKNK